MLGNSSSSFNQVIKKIMDLVQPKSMLELGCGQGKLGELLQERSEPVALTAVQKIFSAEDQPALAKRGYQEIIDADIMDYFRVGFDEVYDMVVALDVIEHFLYSDVISIINFALYRSDYMLLVWPSAHPQDGVHNAFDRHRASFELRDLTNKFDVVFYAQSGFAAMNCVHRYHIALLRGHLNVKVLPPFGA